MRGWAAALLLFVVLLVIVAQPFRAAAAAQEPLHPPAPIQFETRADIILIDANIVDSKGAPVPDIRPEEFVVTVDGEPRPIASAQFVSQEAAEAPAPVQATHYSSNIGVQAGRDIIFVVDENSIPPGAARAVLASANRFLDGIAPTDRLAFVRLPGFEGSVDFTTNREPVREALKKVIGRAVRVGTRVSVAEAVAFHRNEGFAWAQTLTRLCGMSEERQQQLAGTTSRFPQPTTDLPAYEMCKSDIENQARGLYMDLDRRSRESLRGLESLIAASRQMPGPKTLVLLSQGMLGEDNRLEIQRLATAANAARVSVYALHIETAPFDIEDSQALATPLHDQPVLAEGLDTLASAARGARFRIVGNGAGVFERVARELSGYYLLGIEPTGADRDGKPHRLRVEVKRPGVTVRARAQFTMGGAEAGAATSAGDQLLAMLRAPGVEPGLPLRVAAYATPAATADRVKVIVGAEIGDPTTAPLDVRFGVVLVDGDGKAAGNQFGTAKLRPSGDGPGPLQYVGNVEVPPGGYTLRLAVIDAEGRSGSVHHPVEARLKQAGRVNVSDLIISAPVRGRATVPPEVHLTLEGETLQAVLELSAADAKLLNGTRVNFEVAEKGDGPPLVSGRGRFGAARGASRVSSAVLDVGVLPPGVYVARAVVHVPGESPVTTTRPFDVAPRRSAAGAVSSGRVRPPIPPFRTKDVLAPDVVRPFVDHVLERYSPSPAAREALEAIKAGRLQDVTRGNREVGDVGLAFAQGLSLLAADRPAEAAAYFRAALRQSSDFLGAAFYLGATLAAAGKDRDAVGAWQTALIGEVGAAGVYPVLIDGLLRVGEAEQALEFLAEAEPTFTDRDQYTRRLVQAYALAGRYSEARPLVHEYLSRHPDDADLLFLAMHLIYEGHASEDLQEAGPELAQFKEYAATYERLARSGGSSEPRMQLLIVQGWRKALGIR